MTDDAIGEHHHDERGSGESSRLAREWREARETLLEMASELPETRIGRATDRAGWTLKHELAHLASLDEEIRHFIASARGGGPGHHAPGLRRVRGQAMLAAQEMRLARLREHLAVAGEATAVAIEEAGEALGASAEFAEAEAAAISNLIHDRLSRARESLTVFRRHMG